MGLDMTLYARKSFWGTNKQDEKIKDDIRALLPELDNPDIEVESVRVEIIYWRKANAIHKWFVDNVQDGKDECQTSWVSKDSLQELLSLVNQVLEDPDQADHLLPTSDGFFFGGQEYNGYYFGHLERTKKVLDVVLNDERFDNWMFEYRASW